MSDLRKAAQQALEALKIAEAGLADIGDADREPGDDVAWCEARAADALAAPRSAIIALRAALAQPEPEPDESVIFYRCKGCASAYESDCPASCDCMTKAGFLKVKYFTHQSKHRPLTDEEMKRVCVEAWSFDPYEIARAIEKAHGIGGEV